MREGEKSVSGFFWFEGRGEREEKSKERREEGAEVYQNHWEIKVREWG